MKSLIIFSTMFLAISSSHAAPQYQCVAPSSGASATATPTAVSTTGGSYYYTTPVAPFVTPTGPPFTPPLPLRTFQQPVVLPNGVVALASYLQMSVSEDTPDTPIIETQQIGPHAFFAFEFNSTYQGKRCRFHFAFSAGDGSNEEGSQEIYALTSGSGTIDDKLTFNKKPTTGEFPIAIFLPSDPATGRRFQLGASSNGDSLLYAEHRADFDCPTQLTGWETRGAYFSNSVADSSANWSWNHGLVVEVLGGSQTWNGVEVVEGRSRSYGAASRISHT